jgi:archaellum biogenesis protein FlaJ (TadC family)
MGAVSEIRSTDEAGCDRSFQYFHFLVAVMNKILVTAIPKWYPNGIDFASLELKTYTVDVAANAAIWAVTISLLVGIVTALLFDMKKVAFDFKTGLNLSIAGALLAVMNGQGVICTCHP